MKSNKMKLAILILFALIAGCGSGSSTTYGGKGGIGSVGGGGSGGGSGVVSSPTITGNNVLPITVNGSLCLSTSYINEPCVSVTICNPGTSTCQTIPGILLDTGSFGLRIFKSVLNANISLPSVTVTTPSGSLAECAPFGSATFWGPVKTADVYLGNEPAAPSVPIQIFDSSYATVPSSCTLTSSQSPATAYFNGILGVGVLNQDCGSGCVNNTITGVYYACNGSVCNPTTSVALTDQVQNPVVSLPTDSTGITDNNGFMIQLPSIPSGGATAANGYLVLGIGTRSNNTPSGVVRYPASTLGEFITTVTGTTTSYNSLIDSGSNGLFFNPISASQASLLPTSCTSEGWFCPSTTQNFSATNAGYAGSPSGLVNFQIANITLLNSGNNAFNDIGATFEPDFFDWGLPFFYGRTGYVWIGIEGQTSTLGIGPYWAY